MQAKYYQTQNPIYIYLSNAMTKEQGRVLPVGAPPSGVSSLYVTNYNISTQECNI